MYVCMYVCGYASVCPVGHEERKPCESLVLQVVYLPITSGTHTRSHSHSHSLVRTEEKRRERERERESLCSSVCMYCVN